MIPHKLPAEFAEAEHNAETENKPSSKETVYTYKRTNAKTNVLLRHSISTFHHSKKEFQRLTLPKTKNYIISKTNFHKHLTQVSMKKKMNFHEL